jgi:hypothetical protein
MRKLLISLLIIISVTTYAKFEKGKITKLDGKSFDCLIENLHWKGTPNSLNYKFIDQSAIKMIEADQIKTFEIYEVVKFQRFDVDIEISESNFKSLSKSIKPKYQRMNVLMKKLIDSKVSLYQYESKYSTGYYYLREGELAPKFLVFKKYYKIIKTKRMILFNNSYRSQLFSEFPLAEMNINDYAEIEYSENNLIDYFKQYNLENNFKTKVLKNQLETKIETYIYSKIGISSGEFRIGSNNLKVKDAYNLTLGLGGSYYFPFNNYKLVLDGSLGIDIRRSNCYEYYNADATVGLKYNFIDFGKVKNYLGVNIVGRVLLGGDFQYENVKTFDGLRPIYSDVERDLREFYTVFQFEWLCELENHKLGFIYEFPSSILEYYSNSKLELATYGIKYGYKF